MLIKVVSGLVSLARPRNLVFARLKMSVGGAEFFIGTGEPQIG